MAREADLVDVLVVLDAILEDVDLADLPRRTVHAAQRGQLVDRLDQLDDKLQPTIATKIVSLALSPWAKKESLASSAWTVPRHL